MAVILSDDEVAILKTILIALRGIKVRDIDKRWSFSVKENGDRNGSGFEIEVVG